MTISRVSAEETLARRCGNRMEFVGLSAPANGANCNYDDPFFVALKQCGITPASLSVTDADLASLSDDDLLKFLDLAEYRLLVNIYGNLDVVDITVGPRRESLSQFGQQLEKAIERLDKKMRLDYGIGLGTISPGVIALGFQAQEE